MLIANKRWKINVDEASTSGAFQLQAGPITGPPITTLINICLHESTFLLHYIFNIIPNYRGDKSSPKRHRSPPSGKKSRAVGGTVAVCEGGGALNPTPELSISAPERGRGGVSALLPHCSVNKTGELGRKGAAV